MSFGALIQENYKTLLLAMGETIELAFFSLVCASVIGLILGLFSVTKSKILKGIYQVFVDVIRGVPLIVLAFYIYFGMPMVIQKAVPSFKLSALAAGIIALSLNCGAYMAEIIRGGIQAVDKGQMEAARSLGLSYGTSMRKVILPQAIRTMIPSIINQFIITLKDTSILSVIGFPELTKAGKTIIARNYESFKMWTIIAVMYLVVIISLSKLAKVVERRLSYEK